MLLLGWLSREGFVVGWATEARGLLQVQVQSFLQVQVQVQAPDQQQHA